MHEPDRATGPCRNCGFELSGRFCSQCGQRVASLRPTLHELSHEVTHELLHFDGKIIRTLRFLLFKPGKLTREFIDGRRVRYISPIRLYLIASVLFFGTVHLLPLAPLKVSVGDFSAPVMRERAARVNRNPEILARALGAAVPKAMFVLMPLFGLIVHLFERRREPTYVPHLYFGIHFHAFAFVLLSLVAALIVTHLWAANLAAFVLLLLQFPYLVVALRTVYGDSRLAGTSKAFAIAVLYTIPTFATILGVVYWTVMKV